MGNPFGVEVDMWSFGCVLLELLTGQLMFAGTDRADSVQKVILEKKKINFILLFVVLLIFFLMTLVAKD